MREGLCPICGSSAKSYAIDETNLKFLQELQEEGTINDSITLARIVWYNFPKLRLTADSKAIIDGLLASIQQEVKNILSPVDLITRNISPLIQRLTELTDKLPENIKNEFAEVNTELAQKLKTIEEATTKATDPVQRQVKDLSDTISELINKPTARGKAGEIMLGDCWQETFIKDKVCVLGGSGQSDILVVPYLADSQTYGDRIAVERKAGKQRYNGDHLEKAINHAKSENAYYVILVYDNLSNLTEDQKPFYLTTHGEIRVAITDAETGGWRTAREVFEVFQSIASEDKGPQVEVDLAKIQRTIEEMQEINKIIEELRKHNNSSINSSEKVREDIAKLERVIAEYQQKLKDSISQ